MRRSASTSSVLACIVSNTPGGLLSTSPGGSCILGGLALLLLVFRVDTISAEKSALFVKELSFPQTAPTDDAFFNRTGLERIGVVGSELGLLLDWSTGSSAALLYKDKKEKGSTRASPVAASMPMSVPRREKRLTT